MLAVLLKNEEFKIFDNGKHLLEIPQDCVEYRVPIPQPLPNMSLYNFKPGLLDSSIKVDIYRFAYKIRDIAVFEYDFTT